MQDLLTRQASDLRRRKPWALFCYQAKKWIGGFTAALGGLDTLVFSGGIGENAPEVRARMCDGLQCLGVVSDEIAERRQRRRHFHPADPVTVRVMRTDGEIIIAKTVLRVLNVP